MILLDASALLAHLIGQPQGPAVTALLASGGLGMATVNLAETIDVLSRRVGRERAYDALAPLVDGSVAHLVALDAPRAWRLGELRARHYHRTRRPVSLADCALLACADPGDSVATLDRVVIAMARDEEVEVVDL
ncbi:MAG: PIN domain-containing protein [Actinomycetota bacterium]|nr:PIN domain-containing protein [Actinomycetota bacterium]